MGRINWAQVAVFGAIVLLISLVGIMVLPIVFGGYGGWGPMGQGMMGSWGEGGWCPFCGGTGRSYGGGFFGGVIGWLFVLMMVLFPVGLLALVILGIIWLARTVSRPASRAAPVCPDCAKPMAADWRACPYCGGRFEKPE